MVPENDELVSIPKSQLEFLVLKSNMELIQKVNRLVELMEKFEKEYSDE